MKKKVTEGTSKIALRFRGKKDWAMILEYLTEKHVPMFLTRGRVLVVPKEWGDTILGNKKFKAKKARLPRTGEYQVPYTSLVYGGQYIF